MSLVWWKFPPVLNLIKWHILISHSVSEGVKTIFFGYDIIFVLEPHILFRPQLGLKCLLYFQELHSWYFWFMWWQFWIADNSSDGWIISLLEYWPCHFQLCLQNDLLQLFQPFGVITKLVMLRAKNQVLPCMSES